MSAVNVIKIIALAAFLLALTIFLVGVYCYIQTRRLSRKLNQALDRHYSGEVYRITQGEDFQ